MRGRKAEGKLQNFITLFVENIKKLIKIDMKIRLILNYLTLDLNSIA